MHCLILSGVKQQMGTLVGRLMRIDKFVHALMCT